MSIARLLFPEFFLRNSTMLCTLTPSHAYACSDNNFYNLGVILLRASANTSWLLREMLAMRDWMEHMQGHWQDQKAFAIILQKFPEWRNRVARVLPSHLNTYADDFQSGDFIYHEVRFP